MFTGVLVVVSTAASSSGVAYSGRRRPLTPGSEPVVKRISLVSLFVSSAILAITACAGYTRSAMRVASLDHACEQERISVIEKDGTTVVLDVCGRRRVYRDTAGANNPATWTDVTLTTEDCGGGRATEPSPTPTEAPDAGVPMTIPPVADTPDAQVDAGAADAMVPFSTTPIPADAGVPDAAPEAGAADAGAGTDAGSGTGLVDDEEAVVDAGAPDAGARPRRRPTR